MQPQITLPEAYFELATLRGKRLTACLTANTSVITAGVLAAMHITNSNIIHVMRNISFTATITSCADACMFYSWIKLSNETRLAGKKKHYFCASMTVNVPDKPSTLHIKNFIPLKRVGREYKELIYFTANTVEVHNPGW